MMAIEDIRNEIRSKPGLGKSMAKWGALGAVVAIPLPIIGPIIGAIAGADYAYHKGTKRS